MQRVMVIGATGYLGKHVIKELVSQGYKTNALVRNEKKISGFQSINIQEVDFLNKQTLTGMLNQTDVLISCLGITRQQDGLSYMDVDYQANLNVLEEAKASGVKKIIFVSVFKGDLFKKISLCAAKEKFVSEVKKSGLEYCIVRPTGFFSDMSDFLDMAIKGKVYLFGDGKCTINPIHGKDLAIEILKQLPFNKQLPKELNIGGPVAYTHKELAELAFKSLQTSTQVTFIPDFFRWLTLQLGKVFLSTKTFGPIEFFLSLMSVDMTAPYFGNKRIEDFFNEQVESKGLKK